MIGVICLMVYVEKNRRAAAKEAAAEEAQPMEAEQKTRSLGQPESIENTEFTGIVVHKQISRNNSLQGSDSPGSVASSSTRSSIQQPGPHSPADDNKGPPINWGSFEDLNSGVPITPKERFFLYPPPQ
eukprot:GHVT01092480.1.p1 GENE.GHVT01092480.1~~GHVT01092480.1.p1  ORF type:complete len:128 (-),score=9.36 GHVT01092480.1:125-508(-)